MQFEQIKAITEKYGPVMEQLDRLSPGQWTHGPLEYFEAIRKMKLAVADQFMSEVKMLQALPSIEQKVPAANHEE